MDAGKVSAGSEDSRESAVVVVRVWNNSELLQEASRSCEANNWVMSRSY